MTFSPLPGDQVDLGDESIEFTALADEGPASAYVYAEVGREATVYRVIRNQRPFALKVFHPAYQNRRLTGNTRQLSRYKNVPGLSVADRTIVTARRYPDCVGMYPELNYAVLMPWIQGDLWLNLMTAKRPPSRTRSIRAAGLFAKTVSELESRGLAHCDLSNNNFIISPTVTWLELIDIEGMFAPEMPRPKPDISFGTSGYRNAWIAQNGLWGPDSDRFAGAILTAEILTWHNSDIRRGAAGSESFFDEDEIGRDVERFRLMRKHLRGLAPAIAELFEQTWSSSDPANCPSMAAWHDAISSLAHGAARVTAVQPGLPPVKQVKARRVRSGEIRIKESRARSRANTRRKPSNRSARRPRSTPPPGRRARASYFVPNFVFYMVSTMVICGLLYAIIQSIEGAR